MKNEIYVYEWGVNNTIVQFFKVVKRTDKSVTLRELEKEKVKDTASGPGFANYTVKPTEHFIKAPHGSTRGKEFRRKADKDGNIQMEYGIATLWKGKPVETKTGHY